MGKTIKILGWVVTSVLILFIIGLGFIHFVPGYSFSVVRSGSMSPTFNVGDVIITRPAGNKIEPGMILMYQHGSDTISHRVLSVSGDTLVMKGDALEHPDPWQVSISSVKGLYLFKIPYIGYVMSFIRTKLGWFLSIIIPAVVIVGLLIKDILKEAFTDDSNKEVSKKAEVRHNVKEEKIIRKPQMTSNKAQAATNARLQKDVSSSPITLSKVQTQSSNVHPQKEAIRKPQTTLKAQAESNARLRRALVSALEMQKTGG